MSTNNQLSKIELMRQLPIKDREKFLKSLTDEEVLNLQHDWTLWARPKQLEPVGPWQVWLINSGRGFGKTRTGAETIRMWVESGRYKRIALVADTAADARDVMVEGESGILATAHPKFRPTYIPSQRKLIWGNGAVAHTYSAEAYETLRGPQHDAAWVDELAKMPYQQEVWDQLMFGLRLGEDPRVIVTTTPRPTSLIKELLEDDDVVVTRGSMFENESNLAPTAVAQLKKKYEGTRLGRQELYAELLDDNPNAMFTIDLIDKRRVTKRPETLGRIVVAVDPAVTSNDKSDETGIVVSGRTFGDEGGDDGYVLGDRSMKGTPNEWAQAAVDAYREFGADLIVGEVNNGGDMIESLIRHIDPFINYKTVRATRGKAIRAEPISALYEQGRIRHVGVMMDLEDQMIAFDPTLGKNQDSPDRMDALVYSLTELFDEEIVEPMITVL